jgi:hypothetical protein
MTGVVISVVGIVIFVISIAYAFYLKSAFPHHFHLTAFHPEIDGVAIIGIILAVLGLYLVSKKTPPPSKP